MKFDLKINKLTRIKNFEYELYERDYINEILVVIEDLIYETGNIDFYFESLGEVWNVTVFCDLSTFLEQLLDIYNVITGKEEEFILDFYEMDKIRKLLITRINDQIKIKNSSGNNWKSPVDYEFIDIDFLDKEIIVFLDKIKKVINLNCPKLLQYDILQKWFSSFTKNTQ